MSRYFRLVHRWANLIDNVGPQAAAWADQLQYPPDAGVLATEILLHAQAGDPAATERVQALIQYPRMKGFLQNINGALRQQPNYGGFRAEASAMRASPRTGQGGPGYGYPTEPGVSHPHHPHHHKYLIKILQKNAGLPVTGELDPTTVMFLQQYQASRSLPATGIIDPATAHMLLGTNAHHTHVTGQGIDETDPRMLADEARMQGTAPAWHRPWHDRFAPPLGMLPNQYIQPAPPVWTPPVHMWNTHPVPGVDRWGHRFATGDADPSAPELGPAPDPLAVPPMPPPQDVSPAAPISQPSSLDPSLDMPPPPPPPGAPPHHHFRHHRHRRFVAPGQPLAVVPPPPDMPPIDPSLGIPDASQLPDSNPQPDPMGYYGAMNIPPDYYSQQPGYPQAPPPFVPPWQRSFGPGVPTRYPFRQAWDSWGNAVPSLSGPPYGSYGEPFYRSTYSSPTFPSLARTPYAQTPYGMRLQQPGLPYAPGAPVRAIAGPSAPIMHPAAAATILRNPSMSAMHPAAAAAIAATSTPSAAARILATTPTSSLHPAAAATLASHASSPAAPAATMHPSTAISILQTPSQAANHPAAAASLAATTHPSTSASVLASTPAASLHPAASATLAAHASSPTPTISTATAVKTLQTPSQAANHPAAAASLASAHPAVSQQVLATTPASTLHPAASAMLASNASRPASSPTNKQPARLASPVPLHPAVAANAASAHAHAAGYRGHFRGHGGMHHHWQQQQQDQQQQDAPPDPYATGWHHGGGGYGGGGYGGFRGAHGGAYGGGGYGGGGAYGQQHHISASVYNTLPQATATPGATPPPGPHPAGYHWVPNNGWFTSQGIGLDGLPMGHTSGARYGSARFGGYGHLNWARRGYVPSNLPPYPTPQEGIPGSDYLFAEQDQLDNLPAPGGDDGPEAWQTPMAPYGTPGM